jgi:hypothetical protein
MHVLVAGGSGFLGSHLCDALIAERHWVITVGNLLTGREENYGLPPVLRGGHAYCRIFNTYGPRLQLNDGRGSRRSIWRPD